LGLSGDTVVVGAPGDTINGVMRGSAYVFVRSGGSWSEQQKLTSPDGGFNDRFGISAGIDGETAVVGALFADVGLKYKPRSGVCFRAERNGLDSAAKACGNGRSRKRPAWQQCCNQR
jgi:hypothetical protein